MRLNALLRHVFVKVINNNSVEREITYNELLLITLIILLMCSENIKTNC